MKNVHAAVTKNIKNAVGNKKLGGNMIQIKSFNAGRGDAFHIYFPNEKYNILIDGGFNTTYDNEIKVALTEIKERDEVLDLLIVTHMCLDHINGIIKLITENGSNSENKIIEIKEIWFNSYFNSPSYKNKITLSDEIISKLQKLIPQSFEGTFIGNIGIDQVKTLSGLLLEGGYLVNINSINTEDIKSLKRGGIEFKFLSPTKDSLLDLEKLFNKKLGKVEEKLCGSYEVKLNEYFEKYISSINKEISKYQRNICRNNDLESLCQSEDIDKNTPNNEASIAFVLEYKNKKLIFLGDASLKIYEKNLKKHYSNLSNTNFDLIKLSHHGSKYNISSNFLKHIKCSNFLISTDGSGSHKHPDIETISKLIISHKSFSNIILNTENRNNFRWIESIRLDKKLSKKYQYKINILNYIEL